VAEKKGAKKSAKTEGLSAVEKAAMRETIAERKAAARGVDGESAVLAKIATLREPDRSLAKRIHSIVRSAAPSLESKTWYGMPAYAKDGKVVCFFQPGNKFKSRYSTLGFQDAARLDDGEMWPTSYALLKLTPADEKRITALVKKAVR